MEVLGNRELVYRAAVLAMMSGTTVNLVGSTGIGKTDMAQQIGKEFGRKVYVLNSAIQSSEDLIGIPFIDKEKGTTHWTKPYWFPTDGNYLILIDEINRADKSTLNALLPFILNGSLHEHTLPEGVWLMTASNPDTEDYDLVNSFDDRAIFSRMCILNLSVDTLSWRKWIKETHRETKHLGALMEATLNKDNRILPDMQTPNPRSFAKMVDMIKCAKKYNEKVKEQYFNDDVLLSACTGMVGSAFTTQNSTTILDEFHESVERTLEEILETEVDVSNVLKVKSELVNALAKPIDNDALIDKLYEFVLENGKKFPGQFIDALTCVKGPYQSKVNEMIMDLKNREADEYDIRLSKYVEEDAE